VRAVGKSAPVAARRLWKTLRRPLAGLLAFRVSDSKNLAKGVGGLPRVRKRRRAVNAPPWGLRPGATAAVLRRRCPGFVCARRARTRSAFSRSCSGIFPRSGSDARSINTESRCARGIIARNPFCAASASRRQCGLRSRSTTPTTRSIASSPRFVRSPRPIESDAALRRNRRCASPPAHCGPAPPENAPLFPLNRNWLLP
jgi:hypothetical protein